MKKFNLGRTLVEFLVIGIIAIMLGLGAFGYKPVHSNAATLPAGTVLPVPLLLSPNIQGGTINGSASIAGSVAGITALDCRAYGCAGSTNSAIVDDTASIQTCIAAAYTNATHSPQPGFGAQNNNYPNATCKLIHGAVHFISSSLINFGGVTLDLNGATIHQINAGNAWNGTGGCTNAVTSGCINNGVLTGVPSTSSVLYDAVRYAYDDSVASGVNGYPVSGVGNNGGGGAYGLFYGGVTNGNIIGPEVATFNASISGATSGTLSAPVAASGAYSSTVSNLTLNAYPAGQYLFTFDDGETRIVTLTGAVTPCGYLTTCSTTASWTGALNNFTRINNAVVSNLVTFSGSVANTNTGTISTPVSGVPVGTYNFTFSNGEVRMAVVTGSTACGSLTCGTSVSWANDLRNPLTSSGNLLNFTPVTTASFPYSTGRGLYLNTVNYGNFSNLQISGFKINADLTQVQYSNFDGLLATYGGVGLYCTATYNNSAQASLDNTFSNITTNYNTYGIWLQACGQNTWSGHVDAGRNFATNILLGRQLSQYIKSYNVVLPGSGYAYNSALFNTLPLTITDVGGGGTEAQAFALINSSGAVSGAYGIDGGINTSGTLGEGGYSDFNPTVSISGSALFNGFSGSGAAISAVVADDSGLGDWDGETGTIRGGNVFEGAKTEFSFGGLGGVPYSGYSIVIGSAQHMHDVFNDFNLVRNNITYSGLQVPVYTKIARLYGHTEFRNPITTSKPFFGIINPASTVTASGQVTATATSGVAAIATASQSWAVGQPVIATISSGGTMPTGLTAGGIYYVKTNGATSITLESIPTGSTITVTGNTSGQLYLAPADVSVFNGLVGNAGKVDYGTYQLNETPFYHVYNGGSLDLTGTYINYTEPYLGLTTNIVNANTFNGSLASTYLAAVATNTTAPATALGAIISTASTGTTVLVTPTSGVATMATASQSWQAGAVMNFTAAPGAPFSQGVNYFILPTGLTSTSCQVSATSGGAAIVPGSNTAASGIDAASDVSATTTPVVSVPLTAGAWTCSGVVEYTGLSGHTSTQWQQGISNTSNSLGGTGNYTTTHVASVSIGTGVSDYLTPTVHLLLSSPTTYYMTMNNTWTSAGANVSGSLSCQRPY